MKEKKQPIKNLNTTTFNAMFQKTFTSAGFYQF